jgi:hypothetical protein
MEELNELVDQLNASWHVRGTQSSSLARFDHTSRNVWQKVLDLQLRAQHPPEMGIGPPSHHLTPSPPAFESPPPNSDPSPPSPERLPRPPPPHLPRLPTFSVFLLWIIRLSWPSRNTVSCGGTRN